MKRGREPEGERVYELEICPASTDKTLNGKGNDFVFMIYNFLLHNFRHSTILN